MPVIESSLDLFSRNRINIGLNANSKTTEVTLKPRNCIAVLPSAFDISAATRQPKPRGPAKKLAEKISPTIKIAHKISQTSQSISMTVRVAGMFQEH
ncbi:MAG: hypothetical protein ACKVKM_09965 [Verrucomicrobiia bacterium]